MIGMATLMYMRVLKKNGGRIETRKCYKTNKIDWLEHNGWSNLNRIVMVKSTREINGEVSSETGFFISSLKDGAAKNMLGYIRNHWQVESVPQAHKLAA